MKLKYYAPLLLLIPLILWFAVGRQAFLLAAVSIGTLMLAAFVWERWRTEEAFRAKERQLQLITDITPVLLTQCSRELRFRYVNRAYAEVFGLAPEDIVGKSVPEFMGENAYATIRPYVERVLKGERVDYETEIPYRRAGPKFMRVAYLPERNRRGDVVGWVASLTEITDRKRAEEKIKNLNAELQRRVEEFVALIDTAPVGIAVAMDPQCNHIWGNPEFVNMLGTDQPNISLSGPSKDKLRFQIFQHGKPVAADDLPMQRACRVGREVLDEELEVVRADGTILHELCRGMPLLDEHGYVRGCIGVFLNITERKQAETEREQSLAREQAARAEAEQANRIKDEFLAVVSHELRTPLNSILGWAQLMRAGRLDEPTSIRALESIERNAKAQAKLVDDLLDVSRIISGKLRLEIRPIQLLSVINDAIDSLRHALDAKSIRLELFLDPAASHVQGDPARLQQVTWNLLSNAAKFTAGGGRIVIRLERQGTNARLTFTDSGSGIRPEFLPYVFDRFRQEDSSRTRRHGGLGLGLAIVHHLVEMHGGSIEAHSEGEGQGSTFTVTLPLIKDAAEGGAPSQRLLLEQAGSSLVGIRVLIVDDDRDSLEMLRMAVQLHGAKVRTAETTSSALQIFEQWLPDVLIADIGLPDEDGYTLLQKAKVFAAARQKSTHAVALTGYAGEQEGERALAAGFQTYLAKPADTRRLVEAIANLVREAKSAL
jgi:PAS domain S-box-containing protein